MDAEVAGNPAAPRQHWREKGLTTVAAREGMGMLCVDALRAVLLEGRTPANAVLPK